MMAILMSEICWAHKKWNKITSDIKLVFYSSTITMMHGPINIRFTPLYIYIKIYSYIDRNMAAEISVPRDAMVTRPWIDCEENVSTNKDGLHQLNIKLHMRLRRHWNISIETCVNSKDSYSLFGSISLQNRALQSYNLVAFFRCGMEKPFAVVFVPLLRK